MLLPIMTFFPMLGALAAWYVGRKNRTTGEYTANGISLLGFGLAVCALVLALSGKKMEYVLPGFCGIGLHFVLDGFRGIHVAVAALMWLCTTFYSRQYFAGQIKRNRYDLFSLLTYGATLGVFLSADLGTTFIFFEIMSFTSYAMVVQEETPGAMKAGETYIAVAVIGGMVTLMGLFLLYAQVGTLEMRLLLDACRQAENPGMMYLAGALVAFGFAAKAGMFPLHIWLPKTYVEAPAPAAALLSSILSKAGVYGMLVVSCNIFRYDALWGGSILAFGTVTMFLGALIALFSVNLKGTLAGSSMSQIGFILVGLGMMGLLGEENGIAAWGTVLHMVNHSLIKLVLFQLAGVVFINAGKLTLNDIRGFGRNKPLLMAVFLIAGLSVAGMPLFSGYASKTLLHESIVEYMAIFGGWVFHAVEWIFLISGGLTAAYMTKLFVCLFLEQGEPRPGKCMTNTTALCLVIPAVILLVLGLTPGTTMAALASASESFLQTTGVEHSIHFFSLENLKGAAISLSIGAAVYFGVVRTLVIGKDGRYISRWPQWLDLETMVYRPVLAAVIFLGSLLLRIVDRLPGWLIHLIQSSFLWKRPIPEAKPEHTGTMVSRPKHPDPAFQHSLSFALLLFAVGLCIALIYLMVTV